MATIWDDANHSSGETFELATKAPIKIKSAFSSAESSMTKISESEYLNGSPKMEIRIPNNYKETPRAIVFYFKDSKHVYRVIGEKIPNSAFKWTTKGKSTNRGELTTLKELCSLCMMLHKINNTTPPAGADELAEEVAKSYGFTKAQSLMREVYYTSAVAHANNTSKLPFQTGNYLGELQATDFSKDIYQLAKTLTKKAYDNWNPADVWFVKKTDSSEVEALVKEIKKDIRERDLSEKKIAYKLKSSLDGLLKSGILIGVSLKQVDRGAGKADLVSSETVRKKSSDMDFSVSQSYIRDTSTGLPAYGELRTKSGFNIKYGGRANAQKANINVEGQMAGATHQLGAIDAKVIDAMAKDKGLVILKDSDFSGMETIDDLYQEYTTYLKKNSRGVFNKFIGRRSKQEVMEKYSFTHLKRLFATISVFRFMNALTEEERLDLFLLAKKVDKVNPDYYLLH